MAPRSGFLKSASIFVVFPLSSLGPNFTKDKVAGWLKAAGSNLQPAFDDDTTHVVCEEKAWRNEVMAVQRAKEKNAEKGNGKDGVKIVSPNWLDDTLREQRKFKEGAYLWEKLDKGGAGLGTMTGKSGETAGGDEEEQGPRSIPGLMGEVFNEATESYLSERDRIRLEVEAETTERIRREREAEEKQRQEHLRRIEADKKRAEQVERRRAARKGRNEVFTEHHHVYKDPTGFQYEVMLTKVDTVRNVNERITLTVFESNAEPRTYATNLYFAGTARKPRNHVLAAIGTNLPTAFRLFRKAFRERTGVDWDHRIKAHNERVRSREASEASGREQGGVSFVRRGEEEVDFDKRLFQYAPPQYGARGMLPRKDAQKTEKTRPQTVILDDEMEQPRESVDVTMSGALGGEAPSETGVGQNGSTAESMGRSEMAADVEMGIDAAHEQTEGTAGQETAAHSQIGRGQACNHPDVIASIETATGGDERKQAAENATNASELQDPFDPATFDFGNSTDGNPDPNFNMEAFLKELNNPVEKAEDMQIDFTTQGTNTGPTAQQSFSFGNDLAGNNGQGDNANPAPGEGFDQQAYSFSGLPTVSSDPAYQFPAMGTMSSFATNSFSQPGQTQMAEQVGAELLGFTGEGTEVEGGGGSGNAVDSPVEKGKRVDETGQTAGLAHSFAMEAEAEYGD